MTRALRVRMLAAVALLAAAIAVAIQATSALDRLELSTVDARFELRGEQPVPDDMLVVGIDDKTFDELGERFPFSRNRFAKVLETVAAGDPAVIVYDVQFTEPSDDPEADNRLIEASRAAGNVVFSTTEVGDHGESNVFGGEEGLTYARGVAGNGLLPEDPGGVLRRLPTRIDGLDALAVAAVRRLGRPVPLDRMGGEGAWIDYRGPGGHLPRVSFSDVAQGEVTRDRFAGRIVVIGATAPSLQDVHPVPWPNASMSGPEVHATAIDTLLRGAPLRMSSERADLAIAVLLALLAPLLALVLRPWT